MRCTLLTISLTALVFAGLAQGQSGSDDPAHKPSVFLGGEKTKKNGPITSRSVKGIILDASGQPVEGALVTITDLKSKEKWTFITKADGRYHFEELSLVVDYDVSARKGTDVSITKKLSQYDHSPVLTRDLDLAKASPEAAKSEATPSKPAPKN